MRKHLHFCDVSAEGTGKASLKNHVKGRYPTKED